MIYANIKMMKTNIKIQIEKIEFIIIKYNRYYILQKTNSRLTNNYRSIYRTNKIEKIREIIINSFIKEHNKDILSRYSEIILVENSNIGDKVLYESICRNFWQEYKDDYIKDFKEDVDKIIEIILDKKDNIMYDDTENYKIKCIVKDERIREEQQKLIKYTDNNVTRRLPNEIVDIICDFI